MVPSAATAKRSEVAVGVRGSAENVCVSPTSSSVAFATPTTAPAVAASEMVSTWRGGMTGASLTLPMFTTALNSHSRFSWCPVSATLTRSVYDGRIS